MRSTVRGDVVVELVIVTGMVRGVRGWLTIMGERVVRKH